MNPEAKCSLNLGQRRPVCPGSLRRSSGLQVRIHVTSCHVARHVGCSSTRVQPGGINRSSRRPSEGPVLAPLCGCADRGLGTIATNVSTSTQSNDGGYYSLQLPVGNYDLSATKPGFAELIQHNIDLTVGSNIGLELALSIGTATTRVDVTASVTPLLAPNEVSVTTTVPSSLVSNVPVEVAGGMRNSADFLKLTPGYQGNSFSARLNGGVAWTRKSLLTAPTCRLWASGPAFRGSK